MSKRFDKGDKMSRKFHDEYFDDCEEPMECTYTGGLCTGNEDCLHCEVEEEFMEWYEKMEKEAKNENT